MCFLAPRRLVWARLHAAMLRVINWGKRCVVAFTVLTFCSSVPRPGPVETTGRGVHAASPPVVGRSYGGSSRLTGWTVHLLHEKKGEKGRGGAGDIYNHGRW